MPAVLYPDRVQAILLAGGFGTRLRPLTLHTPKAIVPIFDRPLLHYQIDLLRQLPEIDEVILSLNYRPDAIERVVGDGGGSGPRIRYAVEPQPLGTGGAIRFCAPYLDGTVVVFNGDVLSAIDLRAVVDRHRSRGARATIVLAPVADPAAYGLVETDAAGNVRAFREKPPPDAITCNTINAGIYVLEPDTFDRIPAETKCSIERGYFPSLVERGEAFVAYVERGYWIDIGTTEKYVQAHRDIMRGRCAMAPFAGRADTPLVDPTAAVDPGARLEAPCFVGAGARVGAGAAIRADSVIGARATVGRDAVVDGAILWPDSTVDSAAVVRGAVIGRRARVEAHAVVRPETVLGDDSVVTAFSQM